MYLQSLLIPTAKHFLNLQYWHRFRFSLITKHFPSRKQRYSICFWMLRRKNPCNEDVLESKFRLGWVTRRRSCRCLPNIWTSSPYIPHSLWRRNDILNEKTTKKRKWKPFAHNVFIIVYRMLCHRKPCKPQRSSFPSMNWMNSSQLLTMLRWLGLMLVRMVDFLQRTLKRERTINFARNVSGIVIYLRACCAKDNWK